MSVTLLQRGSSGPEVKQLQQQLRRLGSELAANGVFGPATEESVKRFQSQHGLAVDGVVGPLTRDKLFGAEASTVEAESSAGVSSKLAAAVAQWEGGQGPDGLFHPYWDKVGHVWTIGYGHTGLDVTAHTAAWSAEQAKRELRSELDRRYLPPVLALHLPLNQRQIDALVSFVYNVGGGTLERGRSLGDALHGPSWQTEAPKAMLLYDKDASGHPVAGLVRRRRWECELFKGGPYVH
jgi:GH24 family phage-related lysozyme (muramidase)